MNKLIFICILSLSSLVYAGQANTLNQFTGEWEGAGTQSDGEHWSIRINSRPYGYFIDYPSLVCGGRWTLIKSTESSRVFKETLTYGIEHCLNHGQITITPITDDKAGYAWTSLKSKITAEGVLTRKTRFTHKSE
jgi:hypothetical protein